MIIDCISDLHGHYPDLEAGDLLIVAGDLTATDTYADYLKFCEWIQTQKYAQIIFISGNHDNILFKHRPSITKKDNFTLAAKYLCDSGTEFEGLKIWGSPWTRRFEGMNPDCMAFTCETEEELAEKFTLIPDDVDILVTHGPPQQVRDWVQDYPEGVIRACGSKSLKDAYHRIRPKLHIFGHIHEGYGQDSNYTTKFVNASHVNERYEPVNKPIRIEL